MVVRWLVGSVVGILIFFNSAFAADIPRFYGEEVVVTASRMPQLVSKSPWNTSVITSQELANFKTAGEALKTVVGVDSISNGGLGSLNSVRLRGGLNASQVLILVDGRRINSPTLGMFDMGDLLVDNVEKIEVVQAPLSAIYGSDALSGVINIITKAPKDIERSFSVSTGTFGTQQYKFSLGGGNYLLSGDYLKSDGFRVNSDYLAKNVNGKLMFSAPLGQLMVDCSYYDAAKGVPGLPTSESDPMSATAPDNRQTDKNILASISLKREDSLLRVYQNSLDQRSYFFSVYGAGTYETLTLQTGVEWQQKIDSGIGNVLYGWELREDKGKAPGMGEPAIRNYAAFIQDEVGILTASIRADKHSIAGTSINPRLGLVYQANNNLIIRASAGTAFRAPTLNDLYYNDGYSCGDANLKPEKSFSGELGLERQLTKRTSARISYYISTTNDLILWPQVATFENRAVNMGNVNNEGVEFELVRRLGEDGKGFINYTYQRALIKEGVDPSIVGGTVVDKITPFAPQNKCNVGIVLENGSLLVRYVGERFVDLQNEVKLPGYTVVDLTLNKKVGKGQIDFAVNNLFDEVYYEAAAKGYGTATARKYPMPGRSFLLGVKWVI
jgi:outer membrane cobalamin receptor